MKNKLIFLLALVLVVLYLATPALLNNYYNQSLSRSPTILLVGDFTKEEAFGSLVYRGVNEAQQNNSRTNYTQVSIHKVNVNDSLWQDSFAGSNTSELQSELNSLHETLLREIVRFNVVAIISANTSQTITEVLEVGKSFNIPVLITVSTNTSILTNYSDIAFRLVASDKKQAEAISKWSVENGKRTALLYDLSRYGIGLRDNLMANIGLGEILPFALNTTTDLAGIVRYASDENVQSWIIVGYRNQAIEFYGKLRALKPTGSVLFSDGAYGLWLSRINPIAGESYFLSFPTIDTNTNRTIGDDLRGYSVFGFDAFHIICRAMSETRDSGQEKKYLLASNIRYVAPRLKEDHLTRLRYSFDDKGENTQASFSVVELKSDVLP